MLKALTHLVSGGRLVAILPIGARWRSDKKAVAFRAVLLDYEHQWHDSELGAFSAAGTNVRTTILVVDLAP